MCFPSFSCPFVCVSSHVPDWFPCTSPVWYLLCVFLLFLTLLLFHWLLSALSYYRSLFVSATCLSVLCFCIWFHFEQLKPDSNILHGEITPGVTLVKFCLFLTLETKSSLEHSRNLQCVLNERLFSDLRAFQTPRENRLWCPESSRTYNFRTLLLDETVDIGNNPWLVCFGFLFFILLNPCFLQYLHIATVAWKRVSNLWFRLG